MTEEKTEKKKDIQLVIFKLEEKEFGIDISQIKEILRFTEIHAVPNLPDYIMGVINLRGRILCVIDMRSKFAIKREKETDKTGFDPYTMCHGFCLKCLHYDHGNSRRPACGKISWGHSLCMDISD